MVTPVAGIKIRHDEKRAARGQLPWGLFVDVRLNGKRYSPSKFFATEREAEACYGAASAEVAKLREEFARDARLKQALVPELPEVPRGTVLFESLATRWLTEAIRPPRRTAATYRNYKGLLDRHLLPIMRAWPVADEVMSRKRLKEVLADQLRIAGVSLGTRIACQRCLSAFFTWALTELPPKQLQINPAFRLAAHLRHESEIGTVLRQEPNPMTRVQVEAFLAWQQAHYPELYEWFVWLVDAGSRVGEVSALQVTDLDLDRGKAHVNRAFSSSQKWWDRQQGREATGEKDTKTHRSNQYIDLSDRVVEVLRALRTRNLETWMKSGRRGVEPQHVFLNRDGGARRPDGLVYDAFREGCTALKLVGQTGKPFTIHCLRDTFATLSILDGRSTGWVALMLGHSNEETLKAHYYRWVRLVDANPLAGIKR